MANDTQTITEKRKRPRLLKPEEMTESDREAFDKLPDSKKEEYNGKLLIQAGQDATHNARRKQAEERAAKQKEREKETAIKGLITKVREGSLAGTIEALTPEFKKIELPEDEYEKTLERIKTDSVSKAKTSTLPAKPAYTLTRSLITIEKAQIVPPDTVTLPDSTLSNGVRRYGMILPVVVRVSPDDASKYVILDGTRRYHLLEEKDEVMLISGFPDEATAEKAAVVVNRMRSLNIVGTANALTRMATRGMKDTEIRSEMGFKTGEIGKLTSIITDLLPSLGIALKDGDIIPSVAISIAKLPKHLQEELSKLYTERKKTNPSLARIAESDVEAVRQKRAAESAKRDGNTLAGLASGVSADDTKAGKVDNAGKGAVGSSSKPSGKK